MAMTGWLSARSVVSLCSQSLRYLAILRCRLASRATALRRLAEPFFLRETARWYRRSRH
jgi:hypothetical protein